MGRVPRKGTERISHGMKHAKLFSGLAGLAAMLAALATPSPAAPAGAKKAPASARGTQDITPADYETDWFYSDNTSIGSRSTKWKTSRSVEVPDGVQRLGSGVFFECTELTNATIPESVGAIGDYAFYRCTGLSRMAIGSGVTNIGLCAFQGCRGLADVAIPASVQRIGSFAFDGCNDALFDKASIPGVLLVDGWSIGPAASPPAELVFTGIRGIADSAFEDCGRLAKVSVGNGVKHIGNRAFSGCLRLKTIKVGTKNGQYESADGVLFDKGKRTLIQHPAGRSGAYEIPAGVASIGEAAFSGSAGLTEVSIPGGVKSIGAWAFYGCSGLGSVAIPNSVKNIGKSAFSACSGLKRVTIPVSVKRIGKQAFGGCTGLKKVEIRDLAAWCGISFLDWDSNPLSSAHRLFLNGTEVKELAIPGGVTAIGNWAFFGCRGLTAVTIPNGVTSIGISAFGGCSGLKRVAIPNGVTNIGRCAFEDCANLAAVAIPKGVRSIEMGAFSGCGALGRVTIPDGVTNIGWGAFSGCSALESVAIPGSVTSLGLEAFSGCTGLKTVYAPASWEGTDLLQEEVPDGCTVVYGGKYTVRFAPNGGTGTMPPQEIVRDTATPLARNRFTRPGHVFRGWAASAAGKVVHADGAGVKNLTTPGGSVTLYAQWAKSKYKVAFDANGGTGRMDPQQMVWGRAANLRKNAFKRTDCVFTGWAKTKSGKVAYKNAQSVKNLRADGKTATLYAKWARKNYTVAFDANGGRGTMAKQVLTYGQEAKLRKNAFTRTGCTFVGWSKVKGGAVVYKNAQAVKNLRADGKTTVLYAKWKRVETAGAPVKDGAAKSREASSAGIPSGGGQKVFSVGDCGIVAVGTYELAISPDPPAVEELGDREGAETLANPLVLDFRVPAGATGWQLWSAERGVLEEAEVSSSTIALQIPDIGLWHWLHFVDAEGGTVSSTWLFPAD